MCTASWLTEGDRFHFLFNRDERRTRALGQPPAVGWRSRGSLITDLVQAANLAEVATLLGQLALAECAPFRLFADLPGSAAALGAVWNGYELATQPIKSGSGLLCSSSRGDQHVTDVRSALWSPCGAGEPQVFALPLVTSTGSR